MKKALIFLLLGVGLALAATDVSAEEAAPALEPRALKVHVKSAMESTQTPSISRSLRAPFVPTPGEQALAFGAAAEDPRLQESRSSCSRGGSSLCYDNATGKIVYKKTAEYMPSIPGMRAENISVRRNRVTFKYSFQ